MQVVTMDQVKDAKDAWGVTCPDAGKKRVDILYYIICIMYYAIEHLYILTILYDKDILYVGRITEYARSIRTYENGARADRYTLP